MPWSHLVFKPFVLLSAVFQPVLIKAREGYLLLSGRRGYWHASHSGSSNEQACGTAAAVGSAETLFRLMSDTVDFSVVVAASARR